MNSIKTIRTQLGWTRKETAEFLGINIKTLVKYENHPEEVNQIRYLRFLGDLLSKTDAMSKMNQPINTTTDDFKEVIESNSYYVDKTLLIEDLILKNEKAILFTRPRRFGKTLNLSMLRYFFSLDAPKGLFHGLAISKERSLCSQYQNQFPVIFLSFKDCVGNDFEEFIGNFKDMLRTFLLPLKPLLQSKALSKTDIRLLNGYLDGASSTQELGSAISNLMLILNKHYEKKVIVLIDEYDVPLLNTNDKPCFEEVLSFIRSLLTKALKGNPLLQYAVMTGCLKISKESAYTGLNNVVSYGVEDDGYHRYFGYTEDEVNDFIETYFMPDNYDDIKRCYDGYIFGNDHMYCPYDVNRYVADHLSNLAAPANYYWVNSSENALLRSLLDLADSSLRDEIEQLINGETLKKEINLNLTYDGIAKSQENIFSILLSTGYLTIKSQAGNRFELVIPNEEIQYLFKHQISSWIKESVYNKHRHFIIGSFLSKDTLKAEGEINNILRYVIGIHDYSRTLNDQEAFYHGLLLGLLVNENANSDYDIVSNKEAGEGYLDIAIIDHRNRKGVLIEAKVADDSKLDEVARICKEQISKNGYGDYFPHGYEIVSYLSAFSKKHCRIVPLN